MTATRTWTTLATWPNLVTRVHDREDATPIEGLDDKIAVHWVKAIRANPQAMALLDFPSSNDVPDNWKDSKIDAEAVRALTVILPPTSGEELPKPVRAVTIILPPTSGEELPASKVA